MNVSLYSGKEFYKVETTYSEYGIYRDYLNEELDVIETHRRDNDRDNYVTVEFGGCYTTVNIDEYEDRFGSFSTVGKNIGDIEELKERVGRLEEENEEMRSRVNEMSDRLIALEYAPGGSKYKEAEKDFYSKIK